MHMATATKAFRIRFRSDGCNQLLAAYDSADNPDPKVGKSQFGYSTMLFDRPIDAVSKKTPRVGTSSTQCWTSFL